MKCKTCENNIVNIYPNKKERCIWQMYPFPNNHDCYHYEKIEKKENEYKKQNKIKKSIFENSIQKRLAAI